MKRNEPFPEPLDSEGLEKKMKISFTSCACVGIERESEADDKVGGKSGNGSITMLGH